MRQCFFDQYRLIVVAILLLGRSTLSSKMLKKVQHLRDSIDGFVFTRGSPDYETSRPVHNGNCRGIYPLMIVRPKSTQDVSKAVRFAVSYGLEISVRSGGHSFQCQGTKSDSLHIDLRLLNDINFYKPYSVRFGAGLTWKRVLEEVDPKKYTIIHGNVSF